MYETSFSTTGLVFKLELGFVRVRVYGLGYVYRQCSSMDGCVYALERNQKNSKKSVNVLKREMSWVDRRLTR